MLYPIKFTPVYKSRIWGGTKLNEIYSRVIPSTDIGEAWEVCCRDDGMSVVSNGDLQGMPFDRLIDTYGSAIYGHIRMPGGRFPLMLKLLDVNSDLSVQVHPTEEYILNNSIPNDEEKNEMWYVLSAEDNASVICGLRQGTTKESLQEAINEDKIESVLERMPVKTGDVIMIPAGSVHAAGTGMLLFELQQSSDTTYRLYDYKRKDASGKERRLDIDKALGTINYGSSAYKVEQKEFVDRANFSWRRVFQCDLFCLDELEIRDGVYRCRNNKDFVIYTCIKGVACIQGNSVSVELAEGESCFIPACLTNYGITGECRVLASSVRPHVKMFEKDRGTV